MDSTTYNTTAPRAGLHPLVAAAAVAVIIASGVGVAVMTGLLPKGSAQQAEVPVVAAPAPAPQPVAAAAPEPAPAPAAKPVAKAAPKPKPIVHQQAAAIPPAARPEPVQVAQAPAPGSYPAVPPDYREAPPTPPAPVVAARPACADCGTVETMREVEQKGQGTGLGAVAGGIGGLILGHQVGGGAGNKIATVLGAAGGAYAGHQIEKNARSTKAYEVGVRMEDGSYRTIAMASAPTWRTGDHVRVVNGALQSDVR